MRVAISLLTLNNLANVKFTLDSLLKSDIKEHDITLFLWNNKALLSIFDDPFPEYLSSLGINFHYLPEPENLGIVTPRIKAFQRVLIEDKDDNFDYLLEIHDDMLFPDKWINTLFKYHNPNNAIIMPFIFGQFNMDCDLSIVNEICKDYQEHKHYNRLVQNHPWLVRMDVLKEVGYYHADFSPQICEDDEFYYRVIKAGYNTITTKEAVVFHIKSNTRSWALPCDLFNMTVFANKTGMPLEVYKQKHLHFDSSDRNLFQGEFGWIMESLPLPYSLANI